MKHKRMTRDRYQQQLTALLDTPVTHEIRNLATAPDAGPTTADLYLYGPIGMFGIQAADVIRDLSGLDVSTVNVHLNSPGGEVFEGIAILSYLRSYPATINVVIDGIAASIASVIAMAGETITIQPGAQMMIHNAAGLCMGDSDDMRALADLLDRQNANIADIYEARTGVDAADWLTAMAAETWYNADEAVTAKLADMVGSPVTGANPITTDPEPDEDDGWADWLNTYRYAGREAAPAPVIDCAPEAEHVEPHWSYANAPRDDAGRVLYIPDPAPIEDANGRTEWDLMHPDGGEGCAQTCQPISELNPHFPKPTYNGYELPHPNCNGYWRAIKVVRPGQKNQAGGGPTDSPAQPAPAITAASIREALKEAFA